MLDAKGETNSNPDKLFEIPASGYPVSVEESGSARVDAIVCQLVSKRPAPYRSGSSEPPDAVVIANRYMAPEVEAALESLRGMGTTVFPALVKHLGDDRYSYSGVVAAWVNYDVGDAIVEVLCDGHYMHSGYKFRKTPSGGSPYLSFDEYLKAKGAEAWAEWAKTKTRLDIQLDFINWCLVREDERGYVDETQKKRIHGTYEEARQQVRTKYSSKSSSKLESQPSYSETNRTTSGAASDH